MRCLEIQSLYGIGAGATKYFIVGQAIFKSFRPPPCLIGGTLGPEAYLTITIRAVPVLVPYAGIHSSRSEVRVASRMMSCDFVVEESECTVGFRRHALCVCRMRKRPPTRIRYRLFTARWHSQPLGSQRGGTGCIGLRGIKFVRGISLRPQMWQKYYLTSVHNRHEKQRWCPYSSCCAAITGAKNSALASWWLL
jgi:hypothetical protein